MAYLLNSVDLTSYGITAGQFASSNIAVAGCFTMPSRIGDVFYEWGDENGVEPIDTGALDDRFYGGRDIGFMGFMVGAKSLIYDQLTAFYAAINSAPSGTIAFSTPYGDFNVYVNGVDVLQHNGACSLALTLREPVVTLTGGTIPAVGASPYQIDGIPMSSFGLYLSYRKDVFNLPELKPQYFTKLEAEGFQISKRKNNKYIFEGFLVGDSLADFQANVRNLYAMYDSAGLRTFKLTDDITFECLPANGFTISQVYYYDKVIAKFRSELIVTSIT
jgi:hypothetical protein